MQRFESLTVANTVQVLTQAEYNPILDLKAQKALITVETASFRFLVNGGSPTTSEGHLVGAGDSIELNCHDEIKKFKAIRDTATSATIRVTYFFQKD